MENITELPQNLINKIAAGEVVERPASAIKELIENAIDAGSTKITIRIRLGGIKEMTIEDNGSGIRADEIPLAFRRNATSKISKIGDLTKINSLGFRGEALSSIASVADVELHTYHEGSRPTHAIISNGEIKETKTKPRTTTGTTISVLNLFKTIPARKAFLSAIPTESSHIQKIFIALAIANPNIHFRFIKENRNIFNLNPSSLKTRIIQIFKKDIDNDLIEISYDSHQIKINGFIGHPRLAHDRSPKQYLVLNNRPIIERSVIAAIKEGYRNSIPKDRKPSYFLFIKLPPEQVDVNVHPRKTEVRLIKGISLYRPIKDTISKVLDKSLQNELKSRFINSGNDNNNSSMGIEPQSRQRSEDFSRNETFESIKQRPLLNTTARYVEQSFQFTQALLNKDIQTNYTYLNQIFSTYLLFLKDDKLILVDQHAAAERINYERIEKTLIGSKNVTMKSLLTPYVFEVDKTDALNEKIDYLLQIGIEISHLGNNTFQLSAIPEFMGSNNYSKLIESILIDLTDKASTLNLTLIQNKLIATIACHSSTRAGDIVTKDQAMYIIKKLLLCKSPYSCPHGRPIIWEISKSEIAGHFERNK